MSKLRLDIGDFHSSDFNVKHGIDLYTISFNNSTLIDYQIRFLKKFLSGSFIHIVCDNSYKEEEAEKIKKICQKYDVTYIKVSPEKNAHGYSDSHAIAINWVYNNYVKHRKSDFAFLDHDIYPVKNIDVESYLRNADIFGRVTGHDSVYHLWAGFGYFKWDFVKNMKLNFGRKKGWDTGSNNWECIYKNYDMDSIPDLDFTLFDIYDGKFVSEDDYPYRRQLARTVEFYFDKNWLHISGGGEWFVNEYDVDGKSPNKNMLAYKLLDRIFEEGQSVVEKLS